MTTDEFIKSYNANVKPYFKKDGSNPKADDFFASQITKKYIPIERKTALADMIVQSSTFNENEKGEKIYQVNSPVKYILFRLQSIEEYTDIEIDFEHTTEEYNKLSELNLVNMLMKYIPRIDLDEFEYVLNMIESDLEENLRSNAALLDRFSMAMSVAEEGTDEPKE